MPPAQMMPLVGDDSEEEDTLCRRRPQSAPLEGVADERGPRKNLKSITKGQRTTCYECFELENMSGPLHKASSVVSALVDQLGLERSQVQRSYGIWVSMRGGAVLASSTPDERKSPLGKAENDSVCQLRAEVREAVAFIKGVVVAHPTAAFGTAFEELALSLVHLVAHHGASKGSQVNTCEIEVSTAIIKLQFKWVTEGAARELWQIGMNQEGGVSEETARFVLVAVYDALHEGILESLHNTRISAPTLPGPPFCDRILGSEVRKSLWSAWVHSNAIDREKATAADLPCELIADCSVAALIGGSELGLALYLQTIPKAMSDDLRSAFDDAAHYTAEVQRIFELVAFMFLRMRGKDAVIKLYSVGKRSSEQAAALRVKLSALVSNMASKKKAADQAATASKPVPTAPTRAPALPSASAPALPFAQLAWTPPHQAAPPAPPFIFGQPQELQLPHQGTMAEERVRARNTSPVEGADVQA
ncbi:hypothetical protein T492DRAFT_867046 [Pavlovales sp. CCMP2436]|nr:hypothetical protein T492DRAFT_867046 [Pavlovales sp. CCMP2436]